VRAIGNVWDLTIAARVLFRPRPRYQVQDRTAIRFPGQIPQVQTLSEGSLSRVGEVVGRQPIQPQFWGDPAVLKRKNVITTPVEHLIHNLGEVRRRRKR
jgi:hypothetical protein